MTCEDMAGSDVRDDGWKRLPGDLCTTELEAWVISGFLLFEGEDALASAGSVGV
jgi:hypothetical protein